MVFFVCFFIGELDVGNLHLYEALNTLKEIYYFLLHGISSKTTTNKDSKIAQFSNPGSEQTFIKKKSSVGCIANCNYSKGYEAPS